MLGVSDGFSSMLTDGLPAVLDLPTKPIWGSLPMDAVPQTSEDNALGVADLRAGCKAGTN